MQIVDHQAHWYPDSCVEKLIGRSAYPTVRRAAGGRYEFFADDGTTQPAMEALTGDIETHLSTAADAGVDMLVIGPATLAEVMHLPIKEAVELIDPIHEAYAEARRSHPDRLACLAALPMQDPAAALDVLDRAVEHLGLNGVSLIAHNEGRSLADPEYLRLYTRIAELGVPLFLHPGLRSATRALTHGFREEVGLSWMYQTALAALQLIDGGVLDAVPDLVVVHPHLGGVLPYVAGRISPLPGSGAEHPIEHYLRTRFYVDTAASTPAALPLAVQTYGAEHVVFASDHPFLPMREIRRYVENSLPDDVAAQVFANRVPGLPLPPGAE
ncbi:MAG TPA: amidohydrolase family protein [Pseudonocardia sp.]